MLLLTAYRNSELMHLVRFLVCDRETLEKLQPSVDDFRSTFPHLAMALGLARDVTPVDNVLRILLLRPLKASTILKTVCDETPTHFSPAWPCPRQCCCDIIHNLLDPPPIAQIALSGDGCILADGPDVRIGAGELSYVKFDNVRMFDCSGALGRSVGYIDPVMQALRVAVGTPIRSLMVGHLRSPINSTTLASYRHWFVRWMSGNSFTKCVPALLQCFLISYVSRSVLIE